MRVINARQVKDENVMTQAQLDKALKNYDRLTVVDLHHESFQPVAVPLKGEHHIVVEVNHAGTHVRTHKGAWTWTLRSFVSTMENVLELAEKPNIKSVFRGLTKELLGRYPWGKT
jgi:hypothetical protein